MRRPRFAALVCAALAAAVLSSTPMSAGAASLNSQSPSWWSKYQYLSTHTPAVSGPNKSVKVGTNVDVSNEAYPQSETSIAIDPSNPAHLVSGSNEIFTLPMAGYYSSDSGATWNGVSLPLPPAIRTNGYDFGSDPSVAWDTHGNVYYSYIVVFFGAGFGVVGSEMAVARSSDGGKSWKATYFDFQTNEGTFDDKPMITVDNSSTSPRQGTIYVGFDHTGGEGAVSLTSCRFCSGDIAQCAGGDSRETYRCHTTPICWSRPARNPAVKPPSTTMAWPVMNDASSDTKKAAAAAISDGWPKRLRRCRSCILSR